MRALVRRALAAGTVLMVGGLAVVGLRVQQVHLAYQLDALRASRARLETLIRQLDVEVATLKSPARIETRARQIGLATPEPQQVRMAREFVTGRAGVAAAGRGRVVAVVPLPADGLGVAPQP